MRVFRVGRQKSYVPVSPPFRVAVLQRGEFHISHDAWRLISVFSSRWKERSRGSREIFNDLNFKMQLIQGKFQ